MLAFSALSSGTTTRLVDEKFGVSAPHCCGGLAEDYFDAIVGGLLVEDAAEVVRARACGEDFSLGAKVEKMMCWQRAGIWGAFLGGSGFCIRLFALFP